MPDPDLQKSTVSGIATRVLQAVGFSPDGGDYPVLIPHVLPVLGTGDLKPDLLVGLSAYKQTPAFSTLAVLFVRTKVLDALILSGHRPLQDVAVIDYAAGLAICGYHTQKHR